MPETAPFHPSLLDSHLVVDVRSPLEYHEDHLPGAVNVPILTNEERAEIGTIHKLEGPQRARMRGLELTCGRFGAMVREVIAHAAGRPVLVYCWRGGLRSRSMATLLEMTGHPVVQLIGGYKAFRNHVGACFDAFCPAAPLIVIHGMTGTGKTTFITGLDRDRWTVIDLEGLARHRGSAFGSLGLGEQPAQKRFDTLLWDAFRRAPADRPIVVEGESQRIGRYYLPGNLYLKMAESCRVWCSASLETRIRRLSVEYALPAYQPMMLEALDRIRKKLGGTRHAELKRLIEAWDVEGIARGLIEDYYDRMYYRNRDWTAELELELEDFAAAEAELGRFWRAKQR